METALEDTRFHRAMTSVGVGALIMAAEFVVEFLLRYLFHTGWREPEMAIASNSVGGVVGAVLVYRFLSFDYKLRSFEFERQRLRKELNHQIRNALEPIIYSAYRLGDSERQIIEASVNRIQICLKESLLTETPPTDVKPTVH